MRLHLPQQELEITSRKARASIWCCRWKLARILPKIILQKRRLQPLCPADFFVVSGRPSPPVHREKVAHITSMSTGARVYLWHVPCSQTSHNHRKKSKFSSLYCLGRVFPSNQDISEALLKTPTCSHSIFPLNYCGLLAIAQFVWENSLCCTSEWKTDQVKGERKSRKIIFRFF